MTFVHICTITPLVLWFNLFESFPKASLQHVFNYEGDPYSEQLVLLELVPGELGTVIRNDQLSSRSWWGIF